MGRKESNQTNCRPPDGGEGMGKNFNIYFDFSAKVFVVCTQKKQLQGSHRL